MRRALGLILLLAAAVAADVGPAGAAPPDRVRFTAPAGESLLVHGEYPHISSSCEGFDQPVLHARYRGTIEVVRAADGTLSLIGELSFEDYVKGIAEVPRDWPMEALKAQVIAARTYALNRMRAGSGSGEYDLCATTECQVYVGMRVEAGPWGQRWVRAVDETASQVLLHEGEPAVTYYSSTSPGRTFDVEDVFGGEALPYLRGAPEEDDGASPLSRWRVEVPFPDLARFLQIQGLWSGGPIRDVRATRGSISITGADRVTVSKEGLRDALNDTASCVAPERYPTSEPGGYRLPQTVPSRWFRAERSAGAIVLEGRGWGHGIGMVQWGAYGKAERGLSYDQILGAYYRGLSPEAVSLPGSIRILIADGLTHLRVAPSGEATVEPSPGGAAPWEVTGGRGVRVRPGPAPPTLLSATDVSAPRRVESGSTFGGSVTLSEDSTVSLVFGRGADAVRSPATPLEEGTVPIDVPVPELADGRYAVRLVANDGVDTVTTAPLSVRVASGTTSPSPAPTSAPTEAAGPIRPAAEEGAFDVLPLAIGCFVVVLVLLLLGLALHRRGNHAA